jgi:hypothetical protein
VTDVLSGIKRVHIRFETTVVSATIVQPVACFADDDTVTYLMFVEYRRGSGTMLYSMHKRM